MNDKNLKEYIVTIAFSYCVSATDEEAAEDMALAMFEEEYTAEYHNAAVSVEERAGD